MLLILVRLLMKFLMLLKMLIRKSLKVFFVILILILNWYLVRYGSGMFGLSFCLKILVIWSLICDLVELEIWMLLGMFMSIWLDGLYLMLERRWVSFICCLKFWNWLFGWLICSWVSGFVIWCVVLVCCLLSVVRRLVLMIFCFMVKRIMVVCGYLLKWICFFM